jgi:hypothetical protein
MKDLVQIIRDHPGCVAVVDNDGWTLHRQSPSDNPFIDLDDDASIDRWHEQNELCSDNDVYALGDGGYGSGNCYGGDILQALAIIVGIKIESV